MQKVRVILARGPNAELQNIGNEALEPQDIKIRAQNSSIMYIDIANRVTKLDRPPTNIRLSSRDNTLFAKGIQRMAVSRVFMTWITPNVNIRNNTIRFFSSVTGLIHTSVMPEGFYNTRVSLMDNLVVALNNPILPLVPPSGLLWSRTMGVLNPLCAELETAGGSFRFDVTSPMIVKGKQLFNLPRDQTPTTSKLVGAIHGLYTRYVTIESQVLTQWTKNPNQSNRFGNNTLLFRIFTNANLGLPGFIQETVRNLVYFNYKADQNIVAVDFLLLDEFNEELYIPQCAQETDDGFIWDLVLNTET